MDKKELESLNYHATKAYEAIRRGNDRLTAFGHLWHICYMLKLLLIKAEKENEDG